jgi:hypothetical protein
MTTNDPIKADAREDVGALSGSTSLRSPEPISVVSAHPGNDPARCDPRVRISSAGLEDILRRCDAALGEARHGVGAP